MRPDIARAREPPGIIDRHLEGERYEGADTGGGHQKTTDRIRAHDKQDLPVECGTLAKHRVASLQKRMYGGVQQAVFGDDLAHRRFKGGASVGQPNTLLAEQTADRVLEGDQLGLQGCARRQQAALSLPAT